MRKLFFMSGAPGSGKSTLIDKFDLTPYTLSSDAIRLMLCGPIMTFEGKMGINQAVNKATFEMMNEQADRRMERGELLVLDATFQKTKDFRSFIELAKKYNYEMYCIDFSTQPLEQCLEWNKMRPEYKQVPNDVIEKMHNNVKQRKIPNDIKVIDHQDSDSVWKALDTPFYDLSKYKKVHIIGDLQGCYTPLDEYLNAHSDMWIFDPDQFYIFIGDYCDRGIENDKVINFLYNEAINKDNVVLLFGNHEMHLHNYVVNDKIGVSEEFDWKTLPQLQKAGITKEHIGAILDKMVDCFMFKYNDINVICTHAGISTIPNKISLIPSRTFRNGTGFYKDPVDEKFTENILAKEHLNSWYQVHGHRNFSELPTRAAERSFNLEGKVEFGGHLRVATIEYSGNIVTWETYDIKNTIYDTQLSKFPSFQKEKSHV